MPSWTKQRRRSLRNTTSPNSNNIVPTRSCLRLRCPSSPTTEPSASARGVPPEVVQKAPTFKRKMSSGGDGLPTHLLPVLSCCSNCDAAWQYGRLPSACNSDDEDEDSTTTCSKTPARLHASKPTYHVHWTTNAKKLHDSCLGNSYSLASTTLPSATTCLSGRASAFADVDELDAVRRQGNALPSEGEESGINDERQDAPVLGRRWTSIESKEEVKKEFRKHRTRGMRKQGSSEHPQKGGTWQSATLEFLKSARVSSVYI